MADQRRVVVQFTFNSADRSVADNLRKRAPINDNRIGVPTVDRTLRLLNVEQKLGRYDIGAGVARYEPTENDYKSHDSVNVRNVAVVGPKDQTLDQQKKHIAETPGYPMFSEWFKRYCALLHNEGALQ